MEKQLLCGEFKTCQPASSLLCVWDKRWHCLPLPQLSSLLWRRGSNLHDSVFGSLGRAGMRTTEILCQDGGMHNALQQSPLLLWDVPTEFSWNLAKLKKIQQNVQKWRGGCSPVYYRVWLILTAGISSDSVWHSRSGLGHRSLIQTAWLQIPILPRKGFVTSSSLLVKWGQYFYWFHKDVIKIKCDNACKVQRTLASSILWVSRCHTYTQPKAGWTGINNNSCWVQQGLDVLENPEGQAT